MTMQLQLLTLNETDFMVDYGREGIVLNVFFLALISTTVGKRLFILYNSLFCHKVGYI